MKLQDCKAIRSDWAAVQAYRSRKESISVDGESLTIPAVIAVAMHKAPATLTDDPEILNRVDRSVEFLETELKKGRTVYGVTTGFGGSADTRTDEVEKLQIALQQHLNVGILLPSDKGQMPRTAMQEYGLRDHSLPVPVVRAMMLIRCNSLIRGHSGVRVSLIDNVLSLLRKNMTPVVPLRGSISASGDLSSLSYIAGMIEGNPDVYVRCGDSDEPTFLSADKALEQAGVEPIRLHAKEGLGITNGTAASCAAACVAIYQAQQQAMLTQLLTAMSTEALLGTAHNYHPFISATRPHPGQSEAAANILAFVTGSKLAVGKGPETIGLAQDRYALRTAPQWIGPQLEDLTLAYRQIETELNSTTDNPLLDANHGLVHHGGNFQAASITSAMEKTTSALQMFGKLIFAQSCELNDNKLNKGLPPNLSADDPELSFTFKGFDVNMAAYMSELAHVANPVSTHVLSAEMHNQSVNSLALLSARCALEAIELVSLLSATHILTLCQALDLRCLHLEFVKAAGPAIHTLLHEAFHQVVDPENFDAFAAKVWAALQEKWTSLAHLNLQKRGRGAARECLGALFESLSTHRTKGVRDDTSFLVDVETFQDKAGETLSAVYAVTRSKFFKKPATPSYLSPASRLVYEFVRNELGIPMHRGLRDHPTLLVEADDTSAPRKILGTLASDIYMAIRDGRLYDVVMEAVKVSGLGLNGTA
ncbi:hypothetical protein VTN31DRAFT_3239 [Thermomyces dupontii]|uniref:uncharacterized protein n=1 Tax=Talaromyces thermophilus TaxID=28565 RepID=UPI0037440353